MALTTRIRLMPLLGVLAVGLTACADGQPAQDAGSVAPTTTATPTTSTPTTGASTTAPAPDPLTVTEAGVESTIRLSQIDTRDDGSWIDGLATDFQTLYLSIDLDGERNVGDTDRCLSVEGSTWIDERSGLEGVIVFDDLGEVDTAYDLYAVYSTDNELSKPACMYINGTYQGRSGDISSTAGSYSIEWGTEIEFNEITFDGV